MTSTASLMSRVSFDKVLNYYCSRYPMMLQLVIQLLTLVYLKKVLISPTYLWNKTHRVWLNEELFLYFLVKSLTKIKQKPSQPDCCVKKVVWKWMHIKQEIIKKICGNCKRSLHSFGVENVKMSDLPRDMWCLHNAYMVFRAFLSDFPQNPIA